MSTWYPYTIFYRCSIVTESVSPAVCEILSPKHIGVTTHVKSLITWRFVSHMLFPIGALLKLSPYLQAFKSYSAPNIPGSRPWPFEVTWRNRACDYLIPPYSISYRCSIVTDSISSSHRSRDDSIPHIGYSIGAPLEPSPHLQAFSRYLAPNITGSRPWPFKVTWRHRSRDDSISHMGFPIGAPLEPSPYLQAFSRYLAPKCQSNANRHCACAISRDLYPPMQNLGTYLNFPPPHCLFTMTLLLGSDEE